MHPLRQVEADDRLLHWGGLAGLVGGTLMLFVFLFVGIVVGPDPAGLEGPVIRFPEIRTARTVENSLYLVAIALWAAHVLGLSRALSAVRVAPAVVGGMLGVAGSTILAAGALPHMATTRLSDLYHAPGTSLQDQAAIALLWQANQGIFDALLAAGLVLLPAGVVALGMAMFAAPAFGRVFGGATVILGMASLAAAAAFVLDPHSPIVAAGYLALIAFNLVLGWRAYRVSKAPSMASASPARLGVTESAVRL